MSTTLGRIQQAAAGLSFACLCLRDGFEKDRAADSKCFDDNQNELATVQKAMQKGGSLEEWGEVINLNWMARIAPGKKIDEVIANLIVRRVPESIEELTTLGRSALSLYAIACDLEQSIQRGLESAKAPYIALLQ